MKPPFAYTACHAWARVSGKPSSTRTDGCTKSAADAGASCYPVKTPVVHVSALQEEALLLEEPPQRQKTPQGPPRQPMHPSMHPCPNPESCLTDYCDTACERLPELAMFVYSHHHHLVVTRLIELTV